MKLTLKFIALSFLLCLTLPVARGQVVDGEVNELTQGEFKALVHDYAFTPDKWVYKGKQNAIIDFTASWCGPCKRLAPVLSELAREYKDRVVFYKVDIDKCPEVARAYGISSVPTLIFCPADGSTPTAITGAYPRDEIERVIEYVFNKGGE